MQDQLSTPPPEVTLEPETKSSLWRLQGIFFEPSKTFEDINLRPDFVLPLVLCIVIAVIGLMLTTSVIDMSEIIEKGIRENPRTAELTDEQVDQQVEIAMQFAPYFMWAGAVVFPPLLIVAVAGLMMFLVHLTGSETSFKKVLSVSSYTYLFYYVVYSGLSIIVIYLSSDPQALDIQNPLYTNLGHLVDGEESPVLYRLASSVDLIIWYVIYLLGLGLSKVATKTSTAKGVTLVGAIYAIYVLLAIGWNALFG
jgi:hypothetical protein